MGYLSLPPKTLYAPDFEHDACGTGFVSDIQGKRSHNILRSGIQAVSNLTHRGAVGADTKTGDGAGILAQIPHKLFQRFLTSKGVRLSAPSEVAVGMVFLPRDDAQAQQYCRTILEEAVKSRGLAVLAWREVPVDPSVLGDKAQATQPSIYQILVGRSSGLSDAEYESTLFLARKEAERLGSTCSV